jgi:hypothetical protein
MAVGFFLVGVERENGPFGPPGFSKIFFGFEHNSDRASSAPVPNKISDQYEIHSTLSMQTE